MSNIISDEELWQEVSSGSHAAFSVIVERYNSKLYTFIKRRTGSVDDTKDIVQDLFISLWNNREKTKVNTILSAYLHGAAKYAVIDWQIKNRKAISRVELLMEDTEQHSPMHSVEKHIIAAEIREEILKLIDKLPATTRTVFRMSRIDHKNNNEIARELQLSDKTVRNNLSQALNYLRKHLGKIEGTLLIAVLQRVFIK